LFFQNILDFIDPVQVLWNGGFSNVSGKNFKKQEFLNGGL